MMTRHCGGGVVCAFVGGAIVAAAIGLQRTPAQETAPPLKVAIAVTVGKESLTEFQKYLESNYAVRCSWVEAARAEPGKTKGEFLPTPFTGLGALASCDVIVSSLYRTWAPPEQLVEIKRHFTTKPVVGLRQAHHGFQNWLEADREIYGVTYKGHYYGPNITLAVVHGRRDHPLVKGFVPTMPAGGIYQHLDPEKDVEVLIVGSPEGKEPLPQTWLRVNAERTQRVFYTRYDADDMATNDGARDMVVRALCWAAGRDENTLKKKP